MVKTPSKKNDYLRLSCADFLKELASDAASPGGGAAAALTGSIGVSLIEMVSKINEMRVLKKTGQKISSPLFKAQKNSLAKIRSRLSVLMRLDAAAFLRLSKFSKDSRSGPAYEKSLKTAAAVPLEIARRAYQAMRLGESEISRTSRWLSSDLAEAGILLEAAFCSARLNVEINLKSIQDPSFLSKIKTELKDLEKGVELSKMNLLKVLPHD